MSRYSKYSGSASFDFEIERYKSKATGELVTEDKIPIESEEEDYEYQIITLHVSGNSYYVPAYTSGLPENCYPAEGDTEITFVEGPDGKDWSDQLSKSETNSIIEMIEEHASDGGEPDYDDYDDRNDYDDSYL